MNDTYLSIASESRGTYREKASRFIAVAIPVSGEEEVRSKLDRLKKEYYDANHHCYAYRIGQAGDIYRMNDDGEPSGTAGRPIHGQLVSRGLSDVLVVVIRYFGGTKLGVPGLINAYRTAAADSLEHAEKITKILTDRYEVVFGYKEMNDVMRILKDSGASIHMQDCGQECTIVFSLRKAKAEETIKRFSKRNIICRCINLS